MKFLVLFLALTSGLQSRDCKDCTDIKVTVTGFRSTKGDGFLALYSSADGYPLNPSKAVMKLQAPIESGQASFDVKALKPGTYALIVMHDENKNGKMDRNLLGMPKEGYGASNNPHMPLLGPPTFESAIFKTSQGEMTMTIPLHYYPH